MAQHHTQQQDTHSNSSTKPNPTLSSSEQEQGLLPLALQRAQAAPELLTATDARTLQRTLGNQAMGHIYQPMSAQTAVPPHTSIQNLLTHNTNTVLNRKETDKPPGKLQDTFFRTPLIQRNGKDTAIASGETADFISAIGEGLKEGELLTNTIAQGGGDLLGGMGGMIGGTKDMLEAGGSETTLGAISKFFGGTSGFLSGGVKAVELIKDFGLKAAGETLELFSGGFKATGGVVNAGYAEIARRYVKDIAVNSGEPVTKEVAENLLEIIWGKEKSGAFDMAIGSTDVAATMLLSPLYKALTTIGTKAIGSDTGWGLLSKTGMVASSDDVETENTRRVDEMKSKALDLLRHGKKEEVKTLHYYAKTYAPEFAEELVAQIDNLSARSTKKPWYRDNLT